MMKSELDIKWSKHFRHFQWMMYISRTRSTPFSLVFRHHYVVRLYHLYFKHSNLPEKTASCWPAPLPFRFKMRTNSKECTLSRNLATCILCRLSRFSHSNTLWYRNEKWWHEIYYWNSSMNKMNYVVVQNLTVKRCNSLLWWYNSSVKVRNCS